ncbi:uncharacterized protein LOC122509776 [Leptopilina heterotoma]|uniref:uncharacterized protein LOC122509776 n=1 Tax=Leptopilina heterotoma TaxID=63436 RepID=UPI001CA8FF2B|nr:uncharacterized protein LOC122509776 [Leptopilina heterotoma]
MCVSINPGAVTKAEATSTTSDTGGNTLLPVSTSRAHSVAVSLLATPPLGLPTVFGTASESSDDELIMGLYRRKVVSATGEESFVYYWLGRDNLPTAIDNWHRIS